MNHIDLPYKYAYSYGRNTVVERLLPLVVVEVLEQKGHMEV